MTRILHPRILMALAGTSSLILLSLAVGFQYLADLPPCALCIWQRWSHVLASASASLAIWRWPLIGCAMAGLAVTVGGGVAFYHAGVEYGVWAGPAACAGQALDISNIDQLLDFTVDLDAPVSCAEVQWRWLGLSMASWNGLASLGLVLIWGLAAHRAVQASSSASQ